jgi:hypothetical protein
MNSTKNVNLKFYYISQKNMNKEITSDEPIGLIRTLLTGFPLPSPPPPPPCQNKREKCKYFAEERSIITGK